MTIGYAVNGLRSDTEKVSRAEEFAHNLGLSSQCAVLILVVVDSVVLFRQTQLMPLCKHRVPHLIFILFALSLQLLDLFRLFDYFKFKHLGQIPIILQRLRLCVQLHLMYLSIYPQMLFIMRTFIMFNIIKL